MEQEKNLLPLIKVLKDKQEINFKALPKTQVKNSITLYVFLNNNVNLLITVDRLSVKKINSLKISCLYGFLNSQKIFEINLKHIKSIEMAYCI